MTAPAERVAMEPYRVLFPAGAALGILGVLPWLLTALGAPGYPAALHRALMIEGFELCFVAGFLLTAMPAFTHGPRCRVGELQRVCVAIVGFAGSVHLGLEALAHAFAAVALLSLLVSLGSRIRLGRAAPPEEFSLVGVGLLLGVTGTLGGALAAMGWLEEPAPYLFARMLSLGMMLALVLGLGGLLVPTFSAMAEPLTITGIARAGERKPRRIFLVMVALALLGALACEALRHPALGAWLRASAATASGLLAWKLWRRPGRRERLGWCLWGSGWCVLAGLWLAAVLPRQQLAAWHLLFAGGYGLLTLGIASRVVVSHGGHGLAGEHTVLAGPVLTLVILAVLTRVAAGWAPAGSAMHAYSVAAALWMLAWGLWLLRVGPRVWTTRGRPLLPTAPPR
ncbi:MAG: NnrS family protein [Candidatus Eisenbacteria bacterium]